MDIYYKTKYNKYKTKYLNLLNQIGSGSEIIDDDIMYIDSLVCILKPEVKKGIIIYSNFNQPQGTDSLKNLGLKTGKKLQEEGIDFGRTKIHPYIFFRAPNYSNNIDYTTVETEIASSYGKLTDIATKVFIRVDPNRTYTFSSEIRVHYYDNNYDITENFVNSSKKSLSDYLKIINDNKQIINNVNHINEQILYNLFTSEAMIFSNKYRYNKKHFNKFLTREILVSIPHLTSNYFVKI
jgi:hypothetical protein